MGGITCGSVSPSPRFDWEKRLRGGDRQLVAHRARLVCRLLMNFKMWGGGKKTSSGQSHLTHNYYTQNHWVNSITEVWSPDFGCDAWMFFRGWCVNAWHPHKSHPLHGFHSNLNRKIKPAVLRAHSAVEGEARSWMGCWLVTLHSSHVSFYRCEATVSTCHQR